MTKGFDKVTILPCMGLMTPSSNLTRHMAYILKEDLVSDKCNGLCIPALLRGVKEDIEMAEEAPIVVIDGCHERCGSGICAMLSLRPAARFSMIELMRETGLKPGPYRKCISEEGMKLVHIMVDRVKMVVDDILDDPDYVFERQNIVRDAEKVANYENDPDHVLDYIKLGNCFSRPRVMPPIKCLKRAKENVYHKSIPTWGTTVEPQMA